MHPVGTPDGTLPCQIRPSPHTDKFEHEKGMQNQIMFYALFGTERHTVPL